MTVLYGYLFGWTGSFASPTAEETPRDFDRAMMSVGDIEPVSDSRVRIGPRWSIYHLRTLKRLHGTEQNILYADAPYSYMFYTRVSEITGTIVLASERYAVTDEVVRLFNRVVRPALHRQRVNVKRLADILLDRAKRHTFAVTYVLADVPGFGAALSSLSLHGDDIAAAEFKLPGGLALTARQIGVRSSKRRVECGRIANIGSVQFKTDMAADFELFLALVRKAELIRG